MGIHQSSMMTEAQMDYPWYTVVESKDKIEQGDFIKNLPIFIANIPTSDDEHPADIFNLNVIIVSQSCDLEKRKIKNVLVCPFKLYTTFIKENSFFGSDAGKKILDEGNATRFHLLNKCELDEFIYDYIIVDFANTFSVPFDFLENHAKKSGNRLRLLPPYREHLAQNFARFFMRVGLPITIKGFYVEKKECATQSKS